MLSNDDLVRLLSHSQVGHAVSKATPEQSALDIHVEHLSFVTEIWQVIYWIEVPLRNRIHEAFAAEFGPRWWTSDLFKTTVGTRLASEAISSRWAKTQNQQFLTDLTLGFWVKCLASDQDQRTWVPFLHKYFEQGTSRKKLHRQLMRLKAARNSIAHHAPPARIDSVEVFELSIGIAGCIDPTLTMFLEQLAKRRES